MAASKTYYARPHYRFLTSDRDPSIGSEGKILELDESEMLNFARSASPECRMRTPSSRMWRKPSSSPSSKRTDFGVDRKYGTAVSLPVDVPDWSKILKDDYREMIRRTEREDNGEDDEGGGNRIPPHEFLARTRMASLSVHEGIGRTLKGRDLSRVRNAIWEKTGFQD